MSATGITAEQLENFYGQLEAVSTVSQTNISLTGLQNLNGATGADGDRVAVFGQTTGTEDGIYIMRAAAWERSADADPDGSFVADLGSMLFIIEDGTFAGQEWKIDQKRGAGIIGTDALTATLFLDPSALGMNTKVFGEVPTFTVNTFTASIANAPTAGTLRVYRNTGRLLEGAGNDYTLAGTTITFTRRLRPRTTLIVDYEYA
jgi:hypothetical protein